MVINKKQNQKWKNFFFIFQFSDCFYQIKLPSYNHFKLHTNFVDVEISVDVILAIYIYIWHRILYNYLLHNWSRTTPVPNVHEFIKYGLIITSHFRHDFTSSIILIATYRTACLFCYCYFSWMGKAITLQSTSFSINFHLVMLIWFWCIHMNVTH